MSANSDPDSNRTRGAASALDTVYLTCALPHEASENADYAPLAPQLTNPAICP